MPRPQCPLFSTASSTLEAIVWAGRTAGFGGEALRDSGRDGADPRNRCGSGGRALSRLTDLVRNRAYFGRFSSAAVSIAHNTLGLVSVLVSRRRSAMDDERWPARNWSLSNFPARS